MVPRVVRTSTTRVLPSEPGNLRWTLPRSHSHEARLSSLTTTMSPSWIAWRMTAKDPVFFSKVVRECFWRSNKLLPIIGLYSTRNEERLRKMYSSTYRMFLPNVFLCTVTYKMTHVIRNTVIQPVPHCFSCRTVLLIDASVDKEFGARDVCSYLL